MNLSTDCILDMGARSAELSSALNELRGLGYSLDAVSEALGMSEPPLDLLTNTAYCALMYYDVACTSSSPVAVLGMMLACGGSMPGVLYRRVVPEKVRMSVVKCGLVIEAPGDYVRATVSLHEYKSRWFLADVMVERTQDNLRLTQDFPEHVDSPNYSSLCLLRNTAPPRRCDRSFLDVGCGSGFQSVFAASSYGEVVAIDVGARAIAFSNLNAKVNEIQCNVQLADCAVFEAPHQFDRIVFNSPSVPRYKADLDKIDTYTSDFGYEIAVRFIDERLRLLLSPSGIAEIWSVFSISAESGSIAALLEETIRDLHQFDVEIIAERESPFALSSQNIARGVVPRNSYLLAAPDDGEQLLAFVRQQGIDHIVPALLRIRYAANGTGVTRLTEVSSLLA